VSVIKENNSHVAGSPSNRTSVIGVRMGLAVLILASGSHRSDAQSLSSLTAPESASPVHSNSSADMAVTSDNVSRSNSGELQEITVTAEKRSEPINDVAMSITAATGAQLTKMGITDSGELTKIVPGFTYQESTYGTPIYSIRGMGFVDPSMGADPGVTIYIDQVALPYALMSKGATLDLERVEVLKGPQGTLFGQNSTGGAVNYIAAKPTDEFHAGTNVSYGRFDDIDVTGFVSGPITDTLSARVAVRHESADGWQYSMTRPGDSLGSKDFTEARLLVDWKPSEALRLEFSVTGWWDRSETPAQQFEGFRPDLPPNPLTQFVFTALAAQPIASANDRAADWYPGQDYHKDDNFYQTALRGDIDLSKDITLTSISAYSHLDANDPLDSDGTAFPQSVLNSNVGLLTSLSEELRLGGSTESASWMFGGNYQRQVADQYIAYTQNSTHDSVGPYYFDAIGQVLDQQPTTVSGFGSLDYRLDNDITLRGSVRYSDQKRTASGCLTDLGPGAVGVSAATAFSLIASKPIAPGSCVTLNAATFQAGLAHSNLDQDNVSYKVGVDWKPSADTLIYGNVTKGFKSGDYSLVAAIVSSQLAPVTQESVLAFETGVKQSLFEKRMQLNTSVFYYDYRDKQLLGFAIYPIFGELPTVVNIPKSDVIGSEVELSAQPLRELSLKAGVTYVHSEVKENPAGGVFDPFGHPSNYVGEGFPGTPRWQALADVEYAVPVNESMKAFVGATPTYRGSSYAAFGDNSEFLLNSVVLLDLRAGVESQNGAWRAQVWGHNVTNKYYWVGVSRWIDTLDRNPGSPGTFGVSLSYQF
jgi:iron complex outermembrane recepter protein